jgi:hypothetical protein
VLQERLLSRRILYIAEECFFFWCRSHPGIYLSENGEQMEIVTTVEQNLDSLWKGRTSVEKQDWRIPLRLVYFQLMRSIEEYSTKALTKHKDRVVAFEGLMQAYQSAMIDARANEEELEIEWISYRIKRSRSLLIKLYNPANAIRAIGRDYNRPILYKRTEQYAYGVWLGDIHRGLLWRRDGSGTAQRSEIDAPSWSWMSMGTSVKYPDSVGRSYAANPCIELLQPFEQERVHSSKFEQAQQGSTLFSKPVTTSTENESTGPRAIELLTRHSSDADPYSRVLSELPRAAPNNSSLESSRNLNKTLTVLGHLVEVSTMDDTTLERGANQPFQTWIRIFDDELQIAKYKYVCDPKHKVRIGWMAPDLPASTLPQSFFALYVSTHEADIVNKIEACPDTILNGGFYRYEAELWKRFVPVNVLYLVYTADKQAYSRIGMGQILLPNYFYPHMEKKEKQKIILY